MISVLICSANAQLLSQIQKNIYETIGTTVEIISYDNRKNRKGICEAYNILAAKARYPFLCFLHEDVLFSTTDWGKRILKIFSDRSDIGVIGIAGSKYKSASYSGWFTGVKELDCANYIHQYNNGVERVYLKPQNEGSLEEVVCLDGVFVCSRKEVWQRIKFDEKDLTGFHFYDIGFTLEAARICSVAVTYDIDILHITKGGDFGNNWIETAIHYHSAIQDKLPFTIVPVVASKVDKLIMATWLDVLKDQKISVDNRLKWIFNQGLYSKPELYYSILKFIFYSPLRLKYLHRLFKQKKS